MSALYKFRNIDKHAIDTLVNRRLFLANWETLNDPHEAKMLVQTPSLNYHMNPNKLKQKGVTVELSSVRVCSLSASWGSNLLWSHYAAGARGIAIGVELPDSLPGIETIEVIYDDIIPKVKPPIGREEITNALSHKGREWHYEKEIRLLSFDHDQCYIDNFKIVDLVFGLRTTSEDISLVRSIINDESVRYLQACHKPGSYGLSGTQI